MPRAPKFFYFIKMPLLLASDLNADFFLKKNTICNLNLDRGHFEEISRFWYSF